jgi:hypothetical protein
MRLRAHRRAIRRAAWVCALAACALATLYGADRLRLRPLEIRREAPVPEWSHVDGRDRVSRPGRFLVAELTRYDDEFFAYLMYTYLSGVRELVGGELLLTYRESEGRIVYPLRILIPNDLVSAIPRLSEAKQRGLARDVSWTFLTEDALQRLRGQTSVFRMAYAMPAQKSLETMPKRQLLAFIRKWLRFKSATDPRIRRRIEPVPTPLNSEEARRLAEDIVIVADFFALPLDFFLGIGAMENNYMNISGDLQHTIWKRRAEKGDIVLKRAPGKVLVVNSSLGAWQITRETLRYAHRKYRSDGRDYSRLPERLVPPRELDFGNIDPVVLTTYAGLLFRDLLDRCGGDLAMAVGAYNGGLGRPNAKYAEGVRAVASYARGILEHAAVLNGPAAGRQFLSAARPAQ